jgi:hypothetical protein
MDDITTELELDLDYMISLKLHLEIEYNISENNNDIIFELIQYLRELNTPIDKIKTAMYLLYDTIDPSKKEIVDSILTPRNISSIFSNLITDDVVNEHTDVFTGDIINPSNIINMFTQNLNNTLRITFDTNSLNRLDLQNTLFNTLLSQNQIFPFVNIINFPLNTSHTTTENILEKNTKVILYKELSDNLKSKYETCFICLGDFDKDDTIREIKCEHIFHKDCIDPWLLKESYTCPVCRSDIIPKNPI